eukprot:5896610-Karenia_brevis.AAC.1
MERAMKLFRGGHISRGVRMITSQGLGDLTDERIVRQLREKHPARKEAFTEPCEAPIPRMSVPLRSALLKLDDAAASG